MLVMDVECACDVLWIMYAFCVMLNACVLSHVLYMSFACLLSKESNKQKNSKFPSFAECQHWAKKSLPSARGVALGKAGKKCRKKQPLPPVLPSATAWHSAKRYILPSATAWHSAKRSILSSAIAWHSAKRSILPSATW